MDNPPSFSLTRASIHSATADSVITSNTTDDVCFSTSTEPRCISNYEHVGNKTTVDSDDRSINDTANTFSISIEQTSAVQATTFTSSFSLTRPQQQRQQPEMTLQKNPKKHIRPTKKWHVPSSKREIKQADLTTTTKDTNVAEDVTAHFRSLSVSTPVVLEEAISNLNVVEADVVGDKVCDDNDHDDDTQRQEGNGKEQQHLQPLVDRRDECDGNRTNGKVDAINGRLRKNIHDTIHSWTSGPVLREKEKVNVLRRIKNNVKEDIVTDNRENKNNRNCSDPSESKNEQNNYDLVSLVNTVDTKLLQHQQQQQQQQQRTHLNLIENGCNAILPTPQTTTASVNNVAEHDLEHLQSQLLMSSLSETVNKAKSGSSLPQAKDVAGILRKELKYTKSNVNGASSTTFVVTPSSPGKIESNQIMLNNSYHSPQLKDDVQWAHSTNDGVTSDEKQNEISCTTSKGQYHSCEMISDGNVDEKNLTAGCSSNYASNTTPAVLMTQTHNCTNGLPDQCEQIHSLHKLERGRSSQQFVKQPENHTEAITRSERTMKVQKGQMEGTAATLNKSNCFRISKIKKTEKDVTAKRVKTNTTTTSAKTKKAQVAAMTIEGFYVPTRKSGTTSKIHHTKSTTNDNNRYKAQIPLENDTNDKPEIEAIKKLRKDAKKILPNRHSRVLSSRSHQHDQTEEEGETKEGVDEVIFNEDIKNRKINLNDGSMSLSLPDALCSMESEKPALSLDTTTSPTFVTQDGTKYNGYLNPNNNGDNNYDDSTPLIINSLGDLMELAGTLPPQQSSEASGDGAVSTPAIIEADLEFSCMDPEQHRMEQYQVFLGHTDPFRTTATLKSSSLSSKKKESPPLSSSESHKLTDRPTLAGAAVKKDEDDELEYDKDQKCQSGFDSDSTLTRRSKKTPKKSTTSGSRRSSDDFVAIGEGDTDTTTTISFESNSDSDTSCCELDNDGSSDSDDDDDDDDGLLGLLGLGNGEHDECDDDQHDVTPKPLSMFLKLHQALSEWVTPEAVSYVQYLHQKGNASRTSKRNDDHDNNNDDHDDQWELPAHVLERTSDVGASRCNGLMAILRQHMARCLVMMATICNNLNINNGTIKEQQQQQILKQSRVCIENRLATLVRCFNFSRPCPIELDMKTSRALTCVLLGTVLQSFQWFPPRDQLHQKDKDKSVTVPKYCLDVGISYEEYKYLSEKAILNFGHPSTYY